MACASAEFEAAEIDCAKEWDAVLSCSWAERKVCGGFCEDEQAIYDACKADYCDMFPGDTLRCS